MKQAGDILTPNSQEEREAIALLLREWGGPFARALAEFIRAAGFAVNGAQADIASRSRARGSHAGPAFERVSPEEQPAAYEHARKIVTEHRTRGKAGAMFDAGAPAKRLGSRLKQAFVERGIKQTAVAKKLGVAPSVVSRVLKHPEKSRLQTIQRIAEAAGLQLSDLV